MPLILNIDTALETAGIGISDEEHVLDVKTNNRQADHSSWVHIAISEMMKRLNVEMKDLSAVAINAGPGSYTGLRVGMAAAKGICYALNLPLVTVSTLELLAHAVKPEANQHALICAMVDARRMEVFTALYDHQLHELRPATAMILHEDSFRSELDQQQIVFSGNGAAKWKDVCRHPNAAFSPATYTMKDICAIASERYNNRQFTPLAYAEPFYVKSFYTGSS